LKFLDRILGRKAAELSYDQIADLIGGSGGVKIAGVSVNEKTALQVSTVLACVKVIADGCATPPLHVYREIKDGERVTRKKAINIPEYRLLNRRANEWQTSFEWRRLMTIHAALTGTGLSIKVRGENGRVRELIPVAPDQWTMQKISRYEIRYRCYDEFGLIGEFKPDDVFIIRGAQWDWATSMDAVALARSAIGLAIATEQSQAAMHANGLRPSGTYSVDGTLNPEQHERLTAWIKKKTGVANTGDPLVLDRGAKWLSTSMNGVDAQHVETRRLQIEEVCRGYGVFPIMIGHSDKTSTFASSEAFFAAHLIHCLAPWHRAWTQRLDETLLDGSGPLFAEFDTRYMRAGSMKDRAQWARTMAEMGIYTRNEIRDEEGKDPLDGLDDPLTPLNMAQGADQAATDQQQKSFSDLERKLDSLATRQTAQPTVLNLQTAEIEKHLSAALLEMTKTHAEHIKSIGSEMPITINMPDQPAPQVTVNVEAPNVTMEANVPAAQVIVNNTHPVKAIQTVERDENDEITRTVTTYEGGA
jgi:HK97 family phage portal protein